jgi:predicted PurR-regulated permease PerM
VTPNDDRAFNERAVRIGITGAVVFAVLAFMLWVLKSALTPLAVAWVIAYLLDPIIDRFEARRIPRSAAILIFLVLVGAILTGTLLLVVPAIQSDVAGLTERLPGYLDAGIASLLPLLDRVGISLPSSFQEGLDAYRSGDLVLPLEEARAVLNRALLAISATQSSTSCLPPTRTSLPNRPPGSTSSSPASSAGSSRSAWCSACSTRGASP